MDKLSLSTSRRPCQQRLNVPSQMLRMSIYMVLLCVSKAPSDDPPKTFVVMTMFFIKHQINMGIHDIMYQIPQQSIDIIKLMIHNEVQQVIKLEEAIWANSSDHYGTSITQKVEGYQSRLIISST